MKWFTTKLIIVSIILYLTPSGECLRRYHNIHKRWSFDPIVSYYDERHGGGARSFMVYQGDWWWANPLFSYFSWTRVIKAFFSHQAYSTPLHPLLSLPLWLLFPPYVHNKLLPYDDYYHFPMQVYAHNYDKLFRSGYVFTQKPWNVKGLSKVEIVDPRTSPDFRIPERPIAWATKYFYTHYIEPFNHAEYHRYFRMQGCTLSQWYAKASVLDLLGFSRHIKFTNCYCVLVYKRHFPIGMGAVLSFRYILTTASATEMVLEKYRKRLSLINLLGVWYFSDVYNHMCQLYNTISNNSYYATPARIVYHDLWVRPEELNRSHPLPVMYDLALWTTSYRLLYELNFVNTLINIVADGFGIRAQICHRYCYAANTLLKKAVGLVLPPTPVPPHYFFSTDPIYVISNAMVLDQGRIPYPWFRYYFLTHSGEMYAKCPTTEWGWFYCLKMRGPTGRLGTESGAALHIGWTLEHWWGLAGLATVSFRLHTKSVTTFFTILDTHKVLVWLYDSYYGRSPLEYLDVRFKNKVGSYIYYKPKSFGYEKEYREESLKAWWPLRLPWIIEHRNSPWFWYWHYKSIPMERDFFYEIMTF